MFFFKKIKEENLEQILEWRSSEYVTKYMFTDVEYDMEKQRKWYNNIIKSDNNDIYRIVCLKKSNTLIGLISIVDINKKYQSCYTGCYIVGTKEHSNLGAFVLIALLNYIFSNKELNILTVYAEVMKGNKVIDLLKYLGYVVTREEKNYGEKRGKKYDVIFLELTKEKWLKNKISSLFQDNVEFESS